MNECIICGLSEDELEDCGERLLWVGNTPICQFCLEESSRKFGKDFPIEETLWEEYLTTIDSI